MGTTSTPNLNLIKPNPFEEEDSWAPILNENMNKIDTAVFARLVSTAAVSAARRSRSIPARRSCCRSANASR